MLVIVNTVQGKELKDISNEIQTEVETLKWCVILTILTPDRSSLPTQYHIDSNLEKVARDLKEIKDQSRWLTFFFKNLNKSKIEDCISRLQEALEKFRVCRLSNYPSLPIKILYRCHVNCAPQRSFTGYRHD